MLGQVGQNYIPVNNYQLNTSKPVYNKPIPFEKYASTPEMPANQEVGPSKEELKEARLKSLVDAQDRARTNKSWKPRAGKTFCNCGLSQTLSKLGIDVEDKKVGIDNPSTGKPYTANLMAKNLAASAKEKDGYWTEINSKQAQELANQGLPVVGAQRLAGHGHVSTVRPEGKDKGITDEKGVLMNNIGRKNKVQSSDKSFSSKSAVHYYVPREESKSFISI